MHILQIKEVGKGFSLNFHNSLHFQKHFDRNYVMSRLFHYHNTGGLGAIGWRIIAYTSTPICTQKLYTKLNLLITIGFQLSMEIRY